jgi:tryptophan-rich sensory protein
MPFFAKVILSILAVELLGGAGAAFTAPAIRSWYGTLVRPPGTPPNWVFGPVWTTLYAMMGLSGAMLWQHGFQDPKARWALILFITQMALNLSWTPVFFGLHQTGPALVVIVVLWVAILATILALLPISRPAALLLIPYLAWVSYATYLNAGYVWLNR